MTPTHPGVRRRVLGRATLATAAITAVSFLGAGSALAAKTSISFSVSAFPADYWWNGIGTPPPNPSTGSYWIDYDVRYDGAPRVPYWTQQLRGGAVIHSSQNNVPAPVSVVPGDVFRAVRTDNGGVLAETTFSGKPTITSSVIGQPTFAGVASEGRTFLGVYLERRVARNNTGTTYSGNPSTPYPTNDYETVSHGRVTSVGDTTFGGTFGTPITAGDYITASESTDLVANDVRTSTSFSITTPVGVVPPKDATPPKLLKLYFGVQSMDIARFLKSGWNTFAVIDEPATITQTVIARAKTKKGKKSAAPKGKSKPAPKAKIPTVLAVAAGKSTVANETVPLSLKATKKGKKILKKASKKGIKLTLTTTITDLAGNVTTVSQNLKLGSSKKK